MYEPVIGLEIHAQLATKTKIFSSAPVTFGAEPNTAVTPVCLGLPGTLPVLNRNAVDLALRMALSVGCTVQAKSRFLRKNYFYPDLPKGYQISQFQSNDEMPLATGGGIEIPAEGGGSRFVRLVRIHLEEDAGKSIHEEAFVPAGESMVDYNRTGTPLLEIVTEPDLASPAEAAEFVTRLREILVYTGASLADMEKGHLRIDANVSIRPRGEAKLGTKVEIKNMNSVRNCQRALEVEIRRQMDVAGSGGRILQETMLFDPVREDVRPMRGKEESDDYRYFPDPDLVPIVVDRAWIDEVRARLPELPAARRARMTAEYELPADVVQVLTASREVADFSEDALKEIKRRGHSSRGVANLLQGSVLRLANERRKSVVDLGIAPGQLAEVAHLVETGSLSGSMAHTVLTKVAQTGRSPSEVIQKEGMQQVSDAGELEAVVARVIADHPDEAVRLGKGDRKLQGFFMGQIMKATKGKANPKVAAEILARKLA